MIPPEVILLRTMQDKDYDPERDMLINPEELQAYRDLQHRASEEELAFIADFKEIV